MSNRYAIYEMLDKNIKTKLTKYFGGHKISGKCTKVYRDIMKDAIELTINNKRYQFKEPDVIVMDGKNVCFVYGIEEDDITDDELFDEMRLKASNGTNIDDILRDSIRSKIKTINFEIISD